MSGLGLAAGVGFEAGLASYSIESIRSDRDWTLGGFTIAGISGAAKGMFTFGAGFVGGKMGAFDKIFLNPMLKGASTLSPMITYNITKAMLGRIFLTTWVGETFFKMGILGGIGFGGRWFIDWLFGT